MEPIVFTRRQRRPPRIDLTALVDGVFNLLIFFAVTASFAGAQAGLALKLPEAETAQSLKSRIIVAITAAGDIHVDTQQVELDEVGAALTRQTAGDLQTQVVVRPDRSVTYERVVAVMDQVRLAGYHNLALAAVKKRGP